MKNLTPVQLEVLGLIAEGLERKEIAARTYKSLFTVKTHAKRLYKRLGAKNAAHAIHLAHQRGLLE